MTQVAGSAHGSLRWSTSSLSCVVADWYIVEGTSSWLGCLPQLDTSYTQFRHYTLVSHAISFDNRMKKTYHKKEATPLKRNSQVSPSNIQRNWCLRFEYFKTSRANVVRIFHHFLRELAIPAGNLGNKHRYAV